MSKAFKIDYFSLLLIILLIAGAMVFVVKSYTSVGVLSFSSTVNMGRFVVNKICYDDANKMTICEDIPGHRVFTLELRNEKLDRQVLHLR